MLSGHARRLSRDATVNASASMAILNPTCTIYTIFLPTFRSAASSDDSTEDHPENQPILDTGATHCLMPLSWLSEAECESAKRIHLNAATLQLQGLLSELFCTSTLSTQSLSTDLLSVLVNSRA